MALKLILLLFLSISSITEALETVAKVQTLSSGRYTPDWASVDSRPLPSWYDEAKVGIFMHWGVYSVPSFSSEWFWIDWQGKPSPNKLAQKEIEKFMKNNYKPDFSYQDFGPMFTGEFFNATQWAEIIKSSGAKYFVITSKHHDGFAMWPNKYSYSWNSVDVGLHRDVIGELSQAVKKTKQVKFGVYHSLFEWFHPLYLADKATNFSARSFVDGKVFPEMQDLVKSYHPEIFWSDGEWEAPSSYWRSEEFLAWLYNDSPVADSVVVNDRWGSGTLCHHGGYYTCADRFNPGVLQHHKWENAMTLDKNTWGFNRRSNIEDYLTNQDLISTLVSTVAVGGNILVNVGPTKEGTIMPLFQERLSAMGDWLKANGEAIYGSQPWDTCQNDTYTSGVWYTAKDKGETVYAIMLEWPKSNVLTLACVSLKKESKISMLGIAGNLPAKETQKKLVNIALPNKASVSGSYGWVLKMKDLGAL